MTDLPTPTIQPAEHCGDQPPRYSDHSPPTECVLRPGHSGSHADEHGMRWWETTPAPDPVQTAGGEVGPTPAGTVDNADAVRDEELQRLREQIAEALLPVMSSSWQDEGLARRFADAVLAVRDAELQRLRDELAALKSISRGYCPHCGRGDCSPTADQWLEQKRRADQAEDLLRVAHDTSNKSETERARAVQRAEKAEAADWLAQSVAQSAARDAAGALTRQLEAEAALERVRKLRDAWLGNCLEPGQVRRLLDGLTAALDPKETP